MNRSQQLAFLIGQLDPQADMPAKESDRWRLFRSLVNVRMPGPIGSEFIAAQDKLLRNEIAYMGITELSELSFDVDGIALWQGDIVTLRADAVVNAANSALLGCFRPCHACIDNAIHTYAGVQLRNECSGIINRQGFPEPVGWAKITSGYNLPAKYVIHTVGPMIEDSVKQSDRDALTSCYRSCMDLADDKGLESLAFCCISTGVYRFPHADAAQIAISTVKKCLKETRSLKKVVFNVYQSEDAEIYRTALGL